MTGGVEEVGGAVAGAMLARAVEPHAGEPGAGEGVCLNCRAELAGEYCHRCGQKAHVHRSIAAIGHDLAHSVLHFEGKTWRTLPLLAWRPGELTRRYIEGERARFVSPMALFLFSVFLMFAVFSMIGPSMSPQFQQAPQDAARLIAERNAAEQAVAELEGRRAALAAEGKPTEAVESDLSGARAKAAALSAVADAAAPGNRGVRFEAGAKGDDWFSAAYRKAKENPSLLAYKLQTNAYKFSWALIPISVPFLWLLFLFRRQYKAYDHTIFVTYSIAFMTLFAIVLSIVGAIGLGGDWVAFALLIVPPLHMYRQLRGAYRLSRLAAFWRTILLAIFALLAAVVFLLLLIAIGIS